MINSMYCFSGRPADTRQAQRSESRASVLHHVQLVFTATGDQEA